MVNYSSTRCHEKNNLICIASKCQELYPQALHSSLVHHALFMPTHIVCPQNPLNNLCLVFYVANDSKFRQRRQKTRKKERERDRECETE